MAQTVLRYPLKVFTEQTDYLQIDVQEYVPVGSRDKDRNGKDKVSLTRDPQSRFRKNSNKRPISTILLPIPSNVQDGNSVSYQDSQMNSITAAAVGGITNIMKQGGAAAAAGDLEAGIDAVKGAAVSAIDESGLKMGNAQDLITRKLAADAVNIFGGNVTLEQIMARQTGEIFNPNMELLFNGPTLRAFKFQFKMMPRNRDESNQVKSIIRTFKKNMAPKTSSGRLFLNTPNIFELRYRQGESDHSFLHKFKQCVLQDLAVNYTGEGNYATYDDGTPISMVMDLTFKELEPIYDIDYDDPDTNEPLDNTVGY